MSRPRMWMQVGTWPPPGDVRPTAGPIQEQPAAVCAQWRLPRRAEVMRRRWIVVSIVFAALIGAVAGSLATAMLIGGAA